MAKILTEHYVRPVDESSLLAAPVEAWPVILDDAYTHILTPASVERLARQDSGHYVGVGIHARLDQGRLTIDRVAPGSPAATALLAGDVIAVVDGQPIAGEDLETALSHIRGPEGTLVRLTVERSGATRSVLLARREVEAELVFGEVRRLGVRRVGFITVLEFGKGVGAEVRVAAEQLAHRGVDGIVLDLQGNPGGLLSEAVAVASVFLPKGTPVFTERGAHIPTKTFVTRQDPVAATFPLAVLVDGSTASSSEVVAGALRDAHRAKLVGTRTFGKGVIQDVFPLADHWAMQATFAEYLTPAGQALDRRGLDPDVASTEPGAQDAALSHSLWGTVR